MLPIVQRELSVGSRRWTTFWARAIAAGIAFMLLVSALPSAHMLGMVSGQRVFYAISNVAWFVTLFGGAIVTADCLARERREGTLGLLFLTDLKGYDVVLGKLAASSVNAIFCLVALLPVLAVPLLMGGVTLSEVCRVSAALLVTLFLSLSLGMVSSVLCRLAQNAIAVAVFFVFLLWCAAVLVPMSFRSPQSYGVLNPLAAMHYSKPTAFTANPELYYGSVATMAACAILLLWFASKRVGHSWQTRPPRGRLLQWQQFQRDVALGSASIRHAHRKRLLDVNPILWMHSRGLLIQRTVLFVWLGLLLFAYKMNWNRYFHWSDTGAIMITAIFLQALYFGLLAVEAANYLIKTRDDGAVELLLSTSLSSRDLVLGHFSAARRMFRVPTICLLVYMAAWIATALSYAHPDNRAYVAVVGVTMTVNVFTGGRAIVWAALASSLHRRSSLTAATVAFLQVVVLPWLTMIALTVSAPASETATVLAYLVTLLCTHSLVAFMAKQRLNENIRLLLSDPPRALSRKEFEERYRVE